ncbi:Uncharacterized protein FKW44_003446, partial [Caligus rogercresseyi]
SDLSFDEDERPQLYSQGELNYLVRDLGLSKDAAELLGFRFKNKTFYHLALLSTGIDTEKKNLPVFHKTRKF